jgi:zinc/manganese transport system substrate-binding protein
LACEPEWAALARELGGDAVEVVAATTGLQDPHRIEARPSLIAKLRRADLLICTGADLEAGWLPQLLRQAGNAKVQPGQPGHFMAAEQVDRLEVPHSVDRSQGDVHAAGNPHVHLDPRRLLRIAQAASERLAQVDAANAARYRAQFTGFSARWEAAISRWEQQAQPLRGLRVVAHHKDLVYLFHWLGIEEAALLEAKPGIPPSAAHLAGVKASLEQKPAQLVVRSAYQDTRPAQWMAEKAGLPLVVLPYTVGGSDDANDLFALYDVTLRRLLEAKR